VSATSTDFTCQITGQNVVCTNKADFPAGSVSKITIVAKVGKAATGVSITNTASVTGGFVDPTPNDEVDAATLTITRLPGTGSDVPWFVPLIAMVLLGAGGSLLLVARRRRVLT
jgi:LPXTG-motif cell wall-anchored protein